MGFFVYIFHGLGLLLSLLIPGRRRETLARWKKTRPHKLVFEIGAGLTGLIMVGAILWLLANTLIVHHQKSGHPVHHVFSAKRTIAPSWPSA